MLIVGVVATIVACALAPFTCGASAGVAAAIGTTLAKIAIGTAVSLAIGGTIAGVQAALTGHGFWQAFGKSVSENFVDEVVTSFAFTAVTIAASNLIQTRCCFKEGTLVETEEGLKPIEESQVGDMVWAYDEETGESDWKPVVQLFRNESKDWTGVTVNDLEIVSTPGHKYFLPETKKWVSAGNLKVGVKVLLSDGSYAIIETVRSIHYEEAQTTYNFEVEDFHTYYVGNGVLVHNKGCGIGGHGWEGDSTWRANVKRVSQGGDILELKGGIPTQTQAEKLIQQAKGVLLRAENAHLPPNPHIFPHINYLTAHGKKGMIRLVSVIPKIY